MLSNYQLKIVDLYNIPIGNAKKLVPNFFDKEKYALYYENLQFYLWLGLKLKKNISCIRIQSISMAKTICWIQHTEKSRSRKKWWQRWESVVQINKQCCIWKNNGKFKNGIDVKLVSNHKDYLKWTSKPSYMSHKIFDNDLVTIRKNKVTLTLKKPAYIGMCTSEFIDVRIPLWLH